MKQWWQTGLSQTGQRAPSPKKQFHRHPICIAAGCNLPSLRNQVKKQWKILCEYKSERARTPEMRLRNERVLQIAVCAPILTAPSKCFLYAYDSMFSRLSPKLFRCPQLFWKRYLLLQANFNREDVCWVQS